MTTGKIATWLEIVAAAHWRDKRVDLRVHPLTQPATASPQKGGGSSYYGITVDGRWLYSNDGRLTVLKGLKAVARFTHLIKVPTYETGEPAQVDVDCSETADCIAVDRNRSLQGSA